MSRILLVEDDALIAAVARTVLSRGGWEIRHSADGESGLRVALEWNPTLILLDVDLPGMNGFAVCSAVRASARGDEALIVMVTANDDLRSKLTGFQCGADDYLVKPLDPQELFTRVTKLLGAREAQERIIKQRRRDAMNEIVATICHELNQPLTGALGYLELALADPGMTPTIEDGLGDCRRELLRVINIVRRLKRVEDRVVPYLGDVTMIDLPDAPGTSRDANGSEEPETDFHELDEFDK
jgi:CheY-like chemotaxis protein